MHDFVKDYYGRQLTSSDDLKTSACCDPTRVPAWLKPLLARIHPEVLTRYYGCGLVCPPLLEGCRMLDLGCGSGRDVYALAQLVGERGEDYGQAVIYRGTIPGHRDRFVLDKHHDIEAGRVFPVCGNTWHMLHDTRFRPHFEFIGDFSRHYGLFDGCGMTSPFGRGAADDDASSACC